ncbi:MAG: EAL domain-containing protein, partial [Sphingosinicella sp.]
DTGVCTFVNPSALGMLGCTSDELLGHDFGTVVRHARESGEELLGHDSPIHRSLTLGQRHRSGGEEMFVRGERSFPVELTVSPIITGATNNGADLAFHDVSEKRELARQLRFQALHDPLTGLINRRGFEDRLNELLASARDAARTHALCYLDLDQFKVVNDTCGHVAGDELLRQLTPLLRPCVRERDVIARLGGDEFGILLEDCGLETAAQIAQRLLDAIRGYRFAWHRRSFAVGASLGVVGITAGSQGPVSVLSAADAACYVAKEEGRNQIHVSFPNDVALIRRRGEMRWVGRLRQAIDQDQFDFHFQSIAALDRTAEPPCRHELLLRLRDSRGDLIPPGAFLPAAERYQLMPEIDAWVMDHALARIASLVARYPDVRDHRFGINLSGDSLRGEATAKRIEALLSSHSLDPRMLYFEITETVAIANLGAATELMRRLKALGCGLALDDFGSGMSSFAYLKHLPVDYLKIDGSFIKNVVDSRVDQAIVRAAQAIGREMGIAIIAEFVESPAIVETLRRMGIEYGQGYAISRPMPLQDFAPERRHGATAA